MRLAPKFQFEVHAERPLSRGSSVTGCTGRNLERRSQIRFDLDSEDEGHAERPLPRGSSLTGCTGRSLERRS